MAKEKKKLTITIPACFILPLPPVNDNVDKQLALPLSSSVSLQLKPGSGNMHKVHQDSKINKVYLATDSNEQECGYMPLSDTEMVNEHLSPSRGCPSSSKMDSSVNNFAFVNMDSSVFNSSKAHSHDEQSLLSRLLKRLHISIEDTSTSFSAAKKHQKMKKVLKKPKKCQLAEDPDSAGEDWDKQSVQDEDNDVPRMLTVYIQVWSSSALSQSSNKKSAKVSAVDIISKGPFKCNTTDSFMSFKSCMYDLQLCMNNIPPPLQ
ncbi:hypothetical protein PISMIDRAFT_16953 [Pisolithus microcarpus 441]|uniref:Uncharacterized protein n=1 Tax=Pisolithus microcarpus 441 TaxID=765257 RepID=A0A0C9YE51_9AGAM|nr:hypothetical protein BKA83DRAFT_4496214 [Pisolithus microcarpus]KIK14906.1 hypothetical protein PISMIDRAFT_16953 [Pisolithus microcarpus 441]